MRNGGQSASRSTLIVTNVTKIAGVVVGLHAGFAHSPDWRVIALASLMVTGGQVSETLLLGVIDRVFGQEKRD